MGLTRFPHGVSSFGMPLLGGGALTLPLMGGKPSGAEAAQIFFVDPANGLDSNDGSSPDRAMDTVSGAYAKTVDKRGDIVYLLNDGNTSGTAREDATITWSNDNTHLVGLCAPTMISQRARISPSTTLGSIVTPQLTVSGHGNVFSNISFFEGDDEDGVASTCVSVTGHRNYFWNVAMMNMGDAATGNSGDEADSDHLLITGGEENMFDNCYIGLDTATRTGANANVRFASAAARNTFRNCFFPMMADADAPLFIDAPTSASMDRWNLFEHCKFINAVGSTATAQTAATVVHASAGGLLLIKDCMLVGATDWHATDTSNIKLVGHAWGTDDVTIGIAADVDVTA